VAVILVALEPRDGGIAMKRWVGLTLFAVVLLGGAFGLSALAIEWRQETTDLSPLAGEVEDIATDVAEIRSLLQATPTPVSSLPTPAPTLTPEPIVATLAVGTVVEWQGMRLMVDDVQLNTCMDVECLSPRAYLTLENINGSPETTSLFTSPRVVDRSGFVCREGVITSVDRFESLQPGEKFTFQIYWECPNLAIPKTLTLDGIVIFEFADS
jgi:hypothetical protein